MVDWDPEKCRYLKDNFSRLGVEFEVLCIDVRQLRDVEADVVAASPPCEDMTVLKYFNFNETSVGTVPLTVFTARFVEKIKPLTAFYENVYRRRLARLLEGFGWNVERFDMSGIIPQRRVRLLAVYNCRRKA
jgi:site-specific DNA-cytosine methylase